MLNSVTRLTRDSRNRLNRYSNIEIKINIFIEAVPDLRRAWNNIAIINSFRERIFFPGRAVIHQAARFFLTTAPRTKSAQS